MTQTEKHRGCIHIYTGDGKGKTSAAVGLAVRFAGNGGKVLFTQFLKDGSSGEIGILKDMPNITVCSFPENLGFSFHMDERQKAYAAKCYQAYFGQIAAKAEQESFGLLVLDEVVAADRLHFIDHADLLQFLKNKPEHLEVVLTGRDPSADLLKTADYISEVRKQKHPFDEGLPARRGIEY